MRIKVRSEEANFVLPIPTGLVLNSLTASLLPQLLADHGVQLSKEQALRLVSVIRQYRRRHKDWVLVEVHSASGEEVLIKL